MARGYNGRPGSSTGAYELSLAEGTVAAPAVAAAAAAASSCRLGSSYHSPSGVPISRPISVGEGRSGEVIYGNGGRDLWTFEGTEGQNVLIQLQQGPNSNLDTVLDLMDPNGRMECTNDEFGRTSNSRIETLLAETGTYTIVVRGYNWATGAYLLSLSPSADQALDISYINLGGLPEAPSNVTGVPGDGQATISWDAPLSDGGSPITGYVLSGSGMLPGRSERISEIQVAADVSSRTFTGLLSGWEYYFRIKAVNNNGPSQPAYFDLLVGGPPPDQEITEVVHETDGGVTVQWANDRGPGPWDGDWTSATERVTGPDLWTSGYTWVVTAEPGGIESPPISATSYRFSPADFTPGTAYTFTVVATNVIGTGPRSDSSASIMPGIPPGPPALVELRPGDSEITLSWTSPSVDATNTPITGYKVSTFCCSPGLPNGGSLLSEDVLAADVRTRTFTSLQNGSDHTFKVQTLSDAGLSDVYTDYYETTLEPDEIVTELQVPTQPADQKWVYIKYLPRTEDDYATVSVAAMGKLDGGKISDVRVGLGAVGPTAIRASVVEDKLRGVECSLDALRAASQEVAAIVDPTTDPRGSAEYKRDMSVVFTRRALEQVLSVTG